MGEDHSKNKEKWAFPTNLLLYVPHGMPYAPQAHGSSRKAQSFNSMRPKRMVPCIFAF